MLRYANGARGSLWASQVAPGNENGLMLRVYGTKGGVHWRQDNPNLMYWTPYEKPTRIITRGGPESGEAAGRMTRVPPGPPGGLSRGLRQHLFGSRGGDQSGADRQEAAEGRPFPDHRRRREGPRLHRGGGEIVEGERQVGEALRERCGLTVTELPAAGIELLKSVIKVQFPKRSELQNLAPNPLKNQGW